VFFFFTWILSLNLIGILDKKLEHILVSILKYAARAVLTASCSGAAPAFKRWRRRASAPPLVTPSEFLSQIQISKSP